MDALASFPETLELEVKRSSSKVRLILYTVVKVAFDVLVFKQVGLVNFEQKRLTVRVPLYFEQVVTREV